MESLSDAAISLGADSRFFLALLDMRGRILLTGATGFIGNAVQHRLTAEGFYVIASSRSALVIGNAAVTHIGTLSSDFDWSSALENVDAVIHTAARVHISDDKECRSVGEFRKINVAGTLALARQAVGAGVRRFVFISSVKVNGEETPIGEPFTTTDSASPSGAYAISKMEAEEGLRLIAQETGMEVTIIRPGLVYGPGVKANFRSMMNWLSKGVPLPLGAIDNKRSLVALDNLVDLVVTCIDHPAAANQTFLVSDGEDLSTTELLQRMGKALGKPARLLPVPASLLRAGAAILGRRAVAQRLCGSLQVDISKTCELLGWIPPVSVDDALRKTALAFQAR